MLLTLLAPETAYDGASPNGFDLSFALTGALARLGANSFTDIEWLTEGELLAYADEAAKRLAVRTGVFVDRNATTLLLAQQAQYPAPAGWVSTLDVSVATTRLRPTSVAELEALDPAYLATTGTPSRYSMDAGPLGTITIYPQVGS